MIRRIVVFKMKENAEGGTALQNAEKLAEKFNVLKDKLGFLHDIKAGVCINDISGYHMGLTVEYNAIEDIEKYTNHPEHCLVKDFVGKVIETRNIVDYYI